jgi:16S rRNA C1402 N4-methylase RsmH
MRMDATQALSAWHVVNTYPQEPLAKVSPITARRTANALRV